MDTDGYLAAGMPGFGYSQTNRYNTGRQAGKHTQQQAKTFVKAYPEACAYDSKP